MSSDASATPPVSRSSSVDGQNDDRTIVFASYGGAVLDEIRVGQEVVAQNSLGGAGTHATLGARLFLPYPNQTAAWTVHVGDDLPPEVEARLDEWKVCVEWRRTLGLQTTRNIVTYHDSTFGAKTFRYLNPVTSMTPNDARNTKVLSAEVFHFHNPPEALISQGPDLLSLRSERGLDRPVILWEPSRPSCTLENLPACMEAVKKVDVFSPNHDELAALLGKQSVRFDRSEYEKMAKAFVDAGIGTDDSGMIVVRAGEHGSLLMSRAHKPTWLPPFYEAVGGVINPRVVDTTGAGNSFLGGFGVGFYETRDPLVAAQYGTVASSYMVEQLGLPNIVYHHDGSEQWNGTSVRDRLQAYQNRLTSCLGPFHTPQEPRSSDCYLLDDGF